MIERLALSNFRSFSAEAVASFAPITLVYGPNSAGKSSIIKALQFLRQSALEMGGRAFRFGGPYADLGSARTAIHRHSMRKQIGIDVGLGTLKFNNQAFDVSLGYRISVSESQPDRFVVTIIGSGEPISVEFERLPAQPDLARLADGAEAAFHSAVDVLRGLGERLMPDLQDDATALAGFVIDRLVPTRVSGRRSSPRAQKVAQATRTQLRVSETEQVWADFASMVADEFSRTLQSISYLGPLRRPWSRAEAVQAGSNAGGVGSVGENAINVLAQQPDILARVNQSLSAMESGYELCVNPWVSGDGVLEDIAPSLVVPSLRHLESNVSISPTDAGFGLSQLLPIITEMHCRERSLICIEQPELHLHPRLQARFGQLLRDAVDGRNQNRFLVETHSEHLLLRLLRLVREGMLDHADLRILYVDNQILDERTGAYHSSISSEILELRVSGSGALIDPWPGGFFGERWEEM